MLRRGLSHHDAQDATQSFFLKLSRCGLADQWEREAESEFHLQNLLFRSAANHCTDEYRRSHRARRGGSSLHVSLEGDDFGCDVVSAAPTPSEAVELRELNQKVTVAIREMKQRHSARGRGTQFAAALPYLLNEEKHGTQQAAARSVNLPAPAFRALLCRLRRELAGELRQDCAA
jgi:DNA-directed RNA polymerase specialized sigma24 family protein